MTWDAGVPDATKTAKDNRPGFTNNWSYIETELQDEHYFDQDASKDGRHKQVSMDKQSSAPAIPASMDGIFYFLDNVSTQPFFRNAGGIMQLLGIRAMAEFDGRATNGNCTLNYSYNMTSVARTASGLYTATFTTALPNANYLFFGGAIRDNSATDKDLYNVVQSNDSNPPTSKTTALVKMLIQSDDSTKFDPLRGWFVCFGG